MKCDSSTENSFIIKVVFFSFRVFVYQLLDGIAYRYDGL